MAQSNGVQGRVEFKIVLLMLFLIMIHSTSAAITLDINAPESVREGEMLTVDFTATSNVSSNLSQFIFRDGNLVSTANSFQWQTTVNDSGTYLLRFLANNTVESGEETKVIEVLDSPNSVTIISPISDVLSDPQIRIATITSEPASSCNYIIDSVPTGSLSFDGDEWIKILVLSQDKSYNITVECTIGPDISRESVLFVLDTTPPSILTKSPDGNYAGTPIPIEVTTNENSFCKYDSVNVPFELMQSEFTQTGGTDHKQITGISVQGDVTYYVACEDRHENKMTSSEEITFYANLQPSAEITITGGNKKSDILKSGTYEVVLETSEPVLDPTLGYYFSADSRSTAITLEGENMRWEGFFAIPDTEMNDIGTFTFSASDLTELFGSSITKGKIFLVDTKPPEAIEEFEVTTEGINVKLKWIYDGESLDNFVIYRAEDSEIDILDKWDEVILEEYIDNSVLLGERYYYRVAAVDRAGNVGPLSSSKSITVEAIETEEANPTVIRKLNSTQKIFKSNIFDIDLALSKLESETDFAKAEIIRQLNLVDDARQAKNTLETLMKEIDKLKLISLTEEEASNRIDVFLSSSQSQIKKVAQSISIIDNTRQDQALFEQDIDEMINEVLVGVKLNDESKQEYIQDMKNLQDSIHVTLEAITGRIYYMESVNAEDITLIHEKIIVDEPIEDVVIVESIPSEVARRSSDVIFKEQPTILRPDLMVKWERSQLTSTDIYYYVQKIVDINDIRAVKTGVVSKPKAEKLENLITGEFIKEVDEGKSNLFSQIIVFLGFLTLVSLFVYYFAYVKETNIHQKHTIVSKQPIRQITPAHHIHNSLKKGHQHIDNVNYQESLLIYKQILQKLDQEKLDKRHRKQLEHGARRLYSKLMIINHIEDGHKSIDKSDSKKLKESAMKLTRAYKDLTKETELAKHTRRNHSYFLMHIKNQERDEFFNNLKL